MKSIEHYKNLGDGGKMDLLDDFSGNPSVEFLNYLEGELFSIDVDEFVKVEILKFLSRFRHDNRETKDKIVKLIVESYLDNEEMTLSIAAQELMFFDLGKDNFRQISDLLLDKEYQNMDMVDLTSSLIRLLCTKNRGGSSDEYFQELEKIDSYREDIKIMEKLTKKYQDSAMKVLAGYDRGNAIAVVMRVRNTDKTTRGTPHYTTQQVQRTHPAGGR